MTERANCLFILFCKGTKETVTLKVPDSAKNVPGWKAVYIIFAACE